MSSFITGVALCEICFSCIKSEEYTLSKCVEHYKFKWKVDMLQVLTFMHCWLGGETFPLLCLLLFSLDTWSSDVMDPVC